MANKKKGEELKDEKFIDEDMDSFDQEQSADESGFSSVGEDFRSGASEAIKKLISAGIGAAFMTEESIRSYVSGIKLPKEVLHLLLQGASKSKEELLDRVSNEVVRIIKRIDFVKEASRFVEEHKFRVSAEVEVIKKEKGVEE